MSGAERAVRWPTVAAVTLALVLTAAGCTKTDPSSNPFKPCPQGLHRIKDVTYPAPDWWVCEGGQP